MGLHSLRQHISVIPQTPFLFKGSVKQNIDPFSTASDDHIWNVLQESGLYDHVQSVIIPYLATHKALNRHLEYFIVVFGWAKAAFVPCKGAFAQEQISGARRGDF